MSQMYPAVLRESQNSTHPVRTSSEHNLVNPNKTCNSKKELQDYHAEPTKRKEYVCKVCQKRLTRKSGLQTHYLIHTGEKPHVCDICYRSFTDKSTLRTHKFIHSGQKSHVCNICKQGFTQKNHLQGHYATHSDENKLICKICNKAFARKYSLIRHYLVHSRDQEDKKSLKLQGKKVEKGKKEAILLISKDRYDLRKHSAEPSEAVEQFIEQMRVPIFQATDQKYVDATSAGWNRFQYPILLHSEQQFNSESSQGFTIIDQRINNVINQPLNISHQIIRPPVNEDQQDIAQLDQQVSSQISHQTLSQIGFIIHQALATILED